MFKIKKNISLIIFLSFLGFYTFAKYSIFADQISGGKISQNLETEIKILLRKIGFGNNPQIRKTSSAIITHKSDFIFGGYYDTYNFLYIKEDFFSDLAESEKKFWLADTLFSNKYINDRKTIIKQDFLLYSFILSPCLLASIFFKKNKLKYGLITALAVCLGISFFVDSEITTSNKFYSDKKIIQDFDCLEGGISLLNRFLETENKKYFNDKEIENITERLAQLVSLRMTKYYKETAN